MDFKEASRLGSCLAKDYAEDLFRLLATYKSISASEAASRLNLHIKTVQDFLEEMYSLQVLDREEVYEGKRPYFRYWLKTNRIEISIDLGSLTETGPAGDSRLLLRIREKQNARVRFTTSRSNDYISSVAVWAGDGRNRTERKINLSQPQGRFLFHLPFPNADFQSIRQIIANAGTEKVNLPEILDIVNVLIELEVIEKLE